MILDSWLFVLLLNYSIGNHQPCVIPVVATMHCLSKIIKNWRRFQTNSFDLIEPSLESSSYSNVTWKCLGPWDFKTSSLLHFLPSSSPHTSSYLLLSVPPTKYFRVHLPFPASFYILLLPPTYYYFVVSSYFGPGPKLDNHFVYKLK